MVQHAQADNARLLKAYPDGFALDATHHPHITMLQQFVRAADLGKVYTAASRILANEKLTSWNLKAFKYYYIPVPPDGIAGIVVEPTENLPRLQQALLDAVAPFTERTGTVAAFVSDDGGRDIQQGVIDYVANFTRSHQPRSSIRTSRSVSLPKPILTRCSRNPSRRSPSLRWARQSTNSGVLARLARSSRHCR